MQYSLVEVFTITEWKKMNKMKPITMPPRPIKRILRVRFLPGISLSKLNLPNLGIFPLR